VATLSNGCFPESCLFLPALLIGLKRRSGSTRPAQCGWYLVNSIGRGLKSNYARGAIEIERDRRTGLCEPAARYSDRHTWHPDSDACDRAQRCAISMRLPRPLRKTRDQFPRHFPNETRYEEISARACVRIALPVIVKSRNFPALPEKDLRLANENVRRKHHNANRYVESSDVGNLLFLSGPLPVVS
jgi:hypothetical protein